MNLKLKVCGMRDAMNIRAIAALAPDYFGFIFYQKSPRYVGVDFNIPELNPSIKKIGVFVNESIDTIEKIARQYHLDGVQLHGIESPQQCEQLKKNKLVVIKVFSVDDQFDFNRTNAYRTVSDFFLFDTKGRNPGGNAQTFDWRILKRYDQSVPFFLSGGIGPSQIKNIDSLCGMNIHAVDINSGVEVAPALKDLNKVREVTIAIQKPRDHELQS